MSRSRPLAVGIAVGVLSVGGGVAVSQAASTPKSSEAPPAAPAARAERAVEQRLGESLNGLAEKQGKPKKADRSAAKLTPTAKKHRGRVSADQALRLTRQSAPDLALSSKLVPDESAVQQIISDRAIRVTGAGGADHTRGLLGEKNEQATRLLLSSLPMAALKPSGTGANAKVDYELANIDWEAAGARYTLKRPVSEVSLPKAAGGLARLQNGLGVRLADADSTAEGHATGETVTYPNIGTDADMVVRSLPTGFGVGWTLRSPDATHEIRVPIDVPAGQHLREEPTHAVSVVDTNGDVQSEITPATAIDADQQPVALTTKVDGDQVVYDVDHAEGKVAYPVTVDPYVYAKTYNTGQETSIDGWRAQNTPQASAPYQYITPTGQQGSVLGIYGPAGYYAQNESAAWARYPPGNPAIGKGPSSGHGRWTQFIAGSVGYGYAPTQGYHYYNYASGQIFIADSAGNIQNTVGALGSGTSGQTFTLNASGGGLAVDNQIGFGLTLGPYFFQYDHPAAAINMGYFQATADDPTPPSESTTGNAGWLDENGTVTASASDNGFGPKLIGLQTDNSTPIGSYVTRDCPTAQVTAAMVCPYTWSQDLPVAGAPEGISTQYNVACDANNSCSRTPFALKVDRSAPDMTLSGDLFTRRDDQIVAGEAPRPLVVNAADGNAATGDAGARSGVQAIEISVDGDPVKTVTQTQAGDNAPLSTTWTPTADQFATGQHLVSVFATDRVGHQTVTSNFFVHGGAEVDSTDGVPNRPDPGDTAAADTVVDHVPANEVAKGETLPDPADEEVTLDPVPAPPPAFANRALPSAVRRWHVSTQSGWVTVRNDRQQLYIGAGKNGWTFDSILASGTGVGLYGFLYGEYKYCGWINSNQIAPNETNNPNDHCRSFDHIPVKAFAGLVNCDQCNGGTGIILDQDVTGYRNIRPWSNGRYDPRDAAIRYQAGHKVAWRYVTPDNEWVAVSDKQIPSGANWVFLPRRAFPYDSRGKSGLCDGGDGGSPRQAQAHPNWAPVCRIRHS